MKSWTKSLLAGSAVLALAASPALAQDAGGAAGGTTGATGGATGTIDGTTGTPGTTGGVTGGATGTGTTGATGTTGGATGTVDGTLGTGGTTGDATGAATGAMDAPAGAGQVSQILTQRGYTDIRPREGAAEADGSAFTAIDTHGNKVEVVVDPATGEIVRETPKQSKNQ